MHAPAGESSVYGPEQSLYIVGANAAPHPLTRRTRVRLEQVRFLVSTMASQWSATAALVFIGVFLTLAFFETKLPDFMGMNSARHAKRAIHVRSHQVLSLP